MSDLAARNAELMVIEVKEMRAVHQAHADELEGMRKQNAQLQARMDQLQQQVYTLLAKVVGNGSTEVN
jgi:predicted nuclease with TOPRIM domain